LGIDHARILGVHHHHRGMLHRQRLVKTMRIGTKLRAVAEVPFAKLQRAIAGAFEHAGDRDLAGRQALILIGRHVAFAISVIDQWPQGALDLMATDHA
jgi:hypothetical protein